MNWNSNLPIVLVEDHPSHARLIEIILRRTLVPNAFIRFSDGQLAAEYLWRESTDTRRRLTLPLLVILNRHLSGFDLLKRLKTDAQRQRIPVVMLSDTDRPEDINRAYSLGCNAYFTKPSDSKLAIEMIQKLGQFFYR